MKNRQKMYFDAPASTWMPSPPRRPAVTLITFKINTISKIMDSIMQVQFNFHKSRDNKNHDVFKEDLCRVV